MARRAAACLHPPAETCVSEALPLTHHEILHLVAPFSRCGRHLDAAASDRRARRLVFLPAVPQELPSDASGAREILELHAGSALHRLVRRLELAPGREARVETAGEDPGELWQRLQALPATVQYQRCGGGLALWHWQLGADGRRVLLGAQGWAGGLSLQLTVPRRAGEPGELRIDCPDRSCFELPEDLLAVLAGHWSPRLRPVGEGWFASLRLPRREPRRSSLAAQRLVQAIHHLEQVLAAPPGRYHRSFRTARWRVSARRALPLLAALALLAAVLALPRLHLAADSAWRMLIFNAPPILLVLAFCLRELPRIEVPPPPRPGNAGRWPAGAAEAAQPPEAESHA